MVTLFGKATAESTKSQAPNSKETPSPKLQGPLRQSESLVLDYWSFPGAWRLGFGAFRAEESL
jgi:hypothetical protein